MEEWTPKSGVIVDDWTPKSGSVVTEQVEQQVEPEGNRSIWKNLGAEITPQMEQSNPYLSAIAKTGQELFAAPAHLANQIGLNYPRSLANKYGIAYPEIKDNPIADIITKGFGIAGMVKSPLSLMAGGVTKPGIKLGAKILQGAKTGAIGGAAYTPTEDTLGLKQRGVQAGLGAILGAGVGAGTGVVEKVKDVRNINKQLKLFQKQYNASDLPKSELPRKMAEKSIEVRSSLAQAKKDFNNILSAEAEKNAVDIKPKLREFGKNLSQKYDDTLTDLDSLINSQNKTTNYADFGTDFLENSINKVNNDLEAVGRIGNFAKKLGYEVNQVDDGFGNQVYRVYHPEKANEQLGFKEIIKLRQSFNQSNLSTTAKSKVGFTRQDMAYRAMQDTWGEFLQKNYRLTSNEPIEIFNKFNQLQNDYAPLASAKWRAFKVFKPYDKEGIDIAQGTKFFKDYAMGKLDAGKEKLISMLEKGSEFSPGIGDTTSRIKSLGDTQIQSEKQLTSFLTDLVKQKQTAQDLIAKEAKNKQDLAWILGTLTGGSLAIGGIKTLLRREMANRITND
jgi:hypothetical protein